MHPLVSPKLYENNIQRLPTVQYRLAKLIQNYNLLFKFIRVSDTVLGHCLTFLLIVKNKNSNQIKKYLFKIIKK